MAKSGSGGWVRRRKFGGMTRTYNSNKGTTLSSSYGSKNLRITKTYLPGGKIKTTTTTRMGDFVKRQTRTSGGTDRRKKTVKFLKAKKTRYRSGKQLSFTGLFSIIFFFFVIIAIFSK